MDINFTYAISNDDLIGVLRTILLFLESINFKSTSAVLQNECSSKGYSEVTSAPATTVIVHPSTAEVQQAHKGIQTQFPVEFEKCSDDGMLLDSADDNHIYVYYSDASNISEKSSNNNITEKYSTQVMVSENIYLRGPCKCNELSTTDNECATKQRVREPTKSHNIETDFNARCPNTIESEIPTKISAKDFSKVSNKRNSNLRKTYSNPVLKTNSQTSEVPNYKNKEKSPKGSAHSFNRESETTDCKELKKKFRQLQREHHKLMGVTTELTTALQTHILGQSENLNSMLNNCRLIYPDLFKSECSPRCNKFAKDSSNESIKTHKSVINVTSSNKTVDKLTVTVISNRSVSQEKTNITDVSETRVLTDDLSKQESTLIIKETLNKDVNSKSEVSANDNDYNRVVLLNPQFDKGSQESIVSVVVTSKNIDANKIYETVLRKASPSNTNNEDDKSEQLSSVSNGKDRNKVIENPESSPYANIMVQSLNRPQTAIKSRNVNSKMSLRRFSSKSCDESLFGSTLKEKSLPLSDCLTQKTKIQDTSSYADDTEQLTNMKRISPPTVEIQNSGQQTEETVQLNNVQQCDGYGETPEIFVTTENLEKVQQSCNSVPMDQYFELDFRKLKKDMLNGNDNLKLTLVQALRWRITQSDSEIRNHIISSYIRHDLLGLHSAPNACGQSSLELYYCPNKPTPHPLQAGMARLINTFASLTLGRDYLCQDDDLLVSLLVPLITGIHYSEVKLDDITRDMMMATLQKLSLRNRQRLRLISAGLVEHLVSFLATKLNDISEYCMEYSTALLMNLCLHREARERLHSSATDVVSLLADLLGAKKYRCCMPYVNGAMYSLLGDPYINKEAQRLNLAKLIEYHIKCTNGEMRRQLQLILKLHLEGNGDIGCCCDPGAEPENEVDLLEPELDSDDSTELQPSGEELLKNYKLLFPVYGSQVYAVHLQCLCRPVTPIPRSLKTADELVNVVENSETDKHIQVYQDEVIRETNVQEKTRIKQKALESNKNSKPTDEGQEQNVDKSYKTYMPKPRSCRATRTSSTKRNSNSNQGVSTSEPTTSLKMEQENNAKKTSASQQSSRSNSPDMSFCEEAQQFYYTPSAKTGIFESKKTKKLHRVPPSFTRTIPLPIKIEDNACNNSHHYLKTMPIAPIENSSVRNPPFAVDYPSCSSICYRENYIKRHENLENSHCNCSRCKDSCINSNKRNKYMCHCYNAIKGYIDQMSQNNINDNSNNSGKIDDNGIKTKYNTSNLCCNCQRAQNSKTTESVVPNQDKSTSIKVDNTAIVNFSYEELVTAVIPDGKSHECPNAGANCTCYDAVFQSRPKILRTPP